MDQDSIPLLLMSDTDLMDALDALDANSITVLDDCGEEIDPEFVYSVTLSNNVLEDGFTQQRSYAWFASDGCGNIVSISFVVNILNNVPIGGLPGDTVIACAPLPLAAEMLPDTTGMIDVDYTETITNGSIPGEFYVIRTWVFTDSDGNTSVLVRRILWVPGDDFFCELTVPELVECNSHGVPVSGIVIGGVGPYEYLWEVEGEECFIQEGQGTSAIGIYVGWSDVNITMNVIDAYGCRTSCSATISCIDGILDFMITDPGMTAPEQFIQEENPDQGSVNTMRDNLVDIKSWPNPANESLTIRFDALKKGQLSIAFIDLMGHIAHIENIKNEAGLNQHVLDISSLAEGSYIIKLESSGQVITRNLVIIR